MCVYECPYYFLRFLRLRQILSSIDIHFVNSPSNDKELSRGSLRKVCRGDHTIQHDKKIDLGHSDLLPTLSTETHIFISPELPMFCRFRDIQSRIEKSQQFIRSFPIHTNSCYEISKKKKFPMLICPFHFKAINISSVFFPSNLKPFFSMFSEGGMSC